MRTSKCLLLAIGLLAGAGQAAQTYLVAAGVQDYDDPGISPLRYAVQDAQALALAFRDAGVPESNIIVLTTDQQDRLNRPTKFAILHSLQKCRERARSEDTMIFFFAGHGMQQGDTPYLLTADSIREQLDGTALPIKLVHGIMSGFETKQILFVIDACRNDPTAGRAEQDARLDESFARDIRPRAIERPGGKLNAALLLACDIGERAWEMPDEGHGAFTYFMLKGLAGECRGDDGSVRLQALADYVRQEVPAWARRAGRRQTPRFDNPTNVDFPLLRPQAQPQPGRVEAVPLKAALRVTSNPAGATVLVDGDKVGVTPLTGEFDLGAEQQRMARVEIRLEGHAARAFNVELVAGATQTLEDVALVALRPPQPDGGTQPTQPTPPVKPPPAVETPETTTRLEPFDAKAPFNGTYESDMFEGERTILKLTHTGPTKVIGTLQSEGEDLRVEGTVDPATGQFRGRLQMVFEDGQIEAITEPGTVTIERIEEGVSFSVSFGEDTLTAVFTPVGDGAATVGPAPAPAPDEPEETVRVVLGGDTTAGPPPEPLEGVFEGPTFRYDEPNGSYSVEVPQGWIPAPNPTPQFVLFNPGLGALDTLDAIIGVYHARLEEIDRNKPVDQVLDESRQELLEGLLTQVGMAAQDDGRPARLVATREVPGAILQWSGIINNLPATAWLGAVIKGDHYVIIMAVLLQGSEPKYLPGIKRMFVSIQAHPSERNMAAERALVGGQFGFTIDNGELGGLGTMSYMFAADNRVARYVMAGGQQVVMEGTYEVAGTTLYLYFPDGQEVAALVADGDMIMGFQLGYALFTRF